jgi:hypothetical protein
MPGFAALHPSLRKLHEFAMSATVTRSSGVQPWLAYTGLPGMEARHQTSS